MTTELTVTVPGKVMLCGEYGVLTSGARALAFALNTYLEVYVRYGTTARDSLTLHSNLWHAPQQIDATTARDNMLVDTVCELMPSSEHTVEEIRVNSQLNPPATALVHHRHCALHWLTSPICKNLAGV